MSAEIAMARFKLGRIVCTPNILSRLTQEDILLGIRRHQAGDWGDVSDDDRLRNEAALERGLRVWSVYRSAAGIRFWLITEAERQTTTILLPEEY